MLADTGPTDFARGSRISSHNRRSRMLAQPHYKNDLSAAINRKDFATVKKLFEHWLPLDLAPILAELPVEELAALFRHTTEEIAASTFAYLQSGAQKKLLRLLHTSQAGALLNALAPDDRTAFLDELPPDVAAQMIALLSPEERQVTQTLLAYPENSVGRMMTLDFVAVRPEWTVRESLDFIRSHGYDRETLNIIYAVDEQGRLIDDVRVRRFLISPPETPVSALLDGNYAHLSPTDDRETALGIFRKYDRIALPVTDDAKRIIGIVTVDDMLDVAAEEATEDIQKLGGSEALDEPYTTISLSRMFRKRAGWLMALFIGEMFTATAMGFFQNEIERVIVLALFVPLVISAGGNAGSQAATLVIRSLALGEFKLRDWWRVMRREIIMGLALGVVLGTVGFLRIEIWAGLGFDYGAHHILLAGTVGIALIGIVLWGSLAGSMLPLLMKKAGFDPAASSAPFVATLVDVTGLIIYFSVAYLIMLR